MFFLGLKLLHILTGERAELENVRRTFTTLINLSQSCELLKPFEVLFLLEHKQERYIIIYTWKILKGLVPNLNGEITPYESKRLGKIPLIKNRHNEREHSRCKEP